MRISIDMADQGFSPRAIHFGVTLNGKPVCGVITADEELGLVRIANRETPAGIEETTLFGTVIVEMLN